MDPLIQQSIVSLVELSRYRLGLICLQLVQQLENISKVRRPKASFGFAQTAKLGRFRIRLFYFIFGRASRRPCASTWGDLSCCNGLAVDMEGAHSTRSWVDRLLF